MISNRLIIINDFSFYFSRSVIGDKEIMAVVNILHSV